jgi:hypothetical protein
MDRAFLILPDQRMKPAANISKARQQFSLSLEERAGVRSVVKLIYVFSPPAPKSSPPGEDLMDRAF